MHTKPDAFCPQFPLSYLYGTANSDGEDSPEENLTISSLFQSQVLDSPNATVELRGRTCRSLSYRERLMIALILVLTLVGLVELHFLLQELNSDMHEECAGTSGITWVRDTNNCSQYVLCVAGHSLGVNPCPRDEVWSTATVRCVDKTSVDNDCAGVNVTDASTDSINPPPGQALEARMDPEDMEDNVPYIRSVVFPSTVGKSPHGATHRHGFQSVLIGQGGSRAKLLTSDGKNSVQEVMLDNIQSEAGGSKGKNFDIDIRDKKSNKLSNMFRATEEEKTTPKNTKIKTTKKEESRKDEKGSIKEKDVLRGKDKVEGRTKKVHDFGASGINIEPATRNRNETVGDSVKNTDDRTDKNFHTVPKNNRINKNENTVLDEDEKGELRKFNKDKFDGTNKQSNTLLKTDKGKSPVIHGEKSRELNTRRNDINSAFPDTESRFGYSDKRTTTNNRKTINSNTDISRYGVTRSVGEKDGVSDTRNRLDTFGDRHGDKYGDKYGDKQGKMSKLSRKDQTPNLKPETSQRHGNTKDTKLVQKNQNNSSKDKAGSIINIDKKQNKTTDRILNKFDASAGMNSKTKKDGIFHANGIDYSSQQKNKIQKTNKIGGKVKNASAKTTENFRTIPLSKSDISDDGNDNWVEEHDDDEIVEEELEKNMFVTEDDNLGQEQNQDRLGKAKSRTHQDSVPNVKMRSKNKSKRRNKQIVKHGNPLEKTVNVDSFNKGFPEDESKEEEDIRDIDSSLTTTNKLQVTDANDASGPKKSDSKIKYTVTVKATEKGISLPNNTRNKQPVSGYRNVTHLQKSGDGDDRLHNSGQEEASDGNLHNTHKANPGVNLDKKSRNKKYPNNSNQISPYQNTEQNSSYKIIQDVFQEIKSSINLINTEEQNTTENLKDLKRDKIQSAVVEKESDVDVRNTSATHQLATLKHPTNHSFHAVVSESDTNLIVVTSSDLNQDEGNIKYKVNNSHRSTEINPPTEPTKEKDGIPVDGNKQGLLDTRTPTSTIELRGSNNTHHQYTNKGVNRQNLEHLSYIIKGAINEKLTPNKTTSVLNKIEDNSSVKKTEFILSYQTERIRNGQFPVNDTILQDLDNPTINKTILTINFTLHEGTQTETKNVNVPKVQTIHNKQSHVNNLNMSSEISENDTEYLIRTKRIETDPTDNFALDDLLQNADTLNTTETSYVITTDIILNSSSTFSNISKNNQPKTENNVTTAKTISTSPIDKNSLQSTYINNQLHQSTAGPKHNQSAVDHWYHSLDTSTKFPRRQNKITPLRFIYPSISKTNSTKMKLQENYAVFKELLDAKGNRSDNDENQLMGRRNQSLPGEGELLKLGDGDVNDRQHGLTKGEDRGIGKSIQTKGQTKDVHNDVQQGQTKDVQNDVQQGQTKDVHNDVLQKNATDVQIDEKQEQAKDIQKDVQKEQSSYVHNDTHAEQTGGVHKDIGQSVQTKDVHNDVDQEQDRELHNNIEQQVHNKDVPTRPVPTNSTPNDVQQKLNMIVKDTNLTNGQTKDVGENIQQTETTKDVEQKSEQKIKELEQRLEQTPTKNVEQKQEQTPTEYPKQTPELTPAKNVDELTDKITIRDIPRSSKQTPVQDVHHSIKQIQQLFLEKALNNSTFNESQTQPTNTRKVENFTGKKFGFSNLKLHDGLQNNSITPLVRAKLRYDNFFTKTKSPLDKESGREQNQSLNLANNTNSGLYLNISQDMNSGQTLNTSTDITTDQLLDVFKDIAIYLGANNTQGIQDFKNNTEQIANGTEGEKPQEDDLLQKTDRRKVSHPSYGLNSMDANKNLNDVKEKTSSKKIVDKTTNVDVNGKVTNIHGDYKSTTNDEDDKHVDFERDDKILNSDDKTTDSHDDKHLSTDLIINSSGADVLNKDSKANIRQGDTATSNKGGVISTQDKESNNKDKVTSTKDKVTNNKDKVSSTQDKVTNTNGNVSINKDRVPSTETTITNNKDKEIITEDIAIKTQKNATTNRKQGVADNAKVKESSTENTLNTFYNNNIAKDEKQKSYKGNIKNDDLHKFAKSYSDGITNSSKDEETNIHKAKGTSVNRDEITKSQNEKMSNRYKDKTSNNFKIDLTKSETVKSIKKLTDKVSNSHKYDINNVHKGKQAHKDDKEDEKLKMKIEAEVTTIRHNNLQSSQKQNTRKEKIHHENSSKHESHELGQWSEKASRKNGVRPKMFDTNVDKTNNVDTNEKFRQKSVRLTLSKNKTVVQTLDKHRVHTGGHNAGEEDGNKVGQLQKTKLLYQTTDVSTSRLLVVPTGQIMYGEDEVKKEGIQGGEKKDKVATSKIPGYFKKGNFKRTTPSNEKLWWQYSENGKFEQTDILNRQHWSTTTSAGLALPSTPASNLPELTKADFVPSSTPFEQLLASTTEGWLPRSAELGNLLQLSTTIDLLEQTSTPGTSLEIQDSVEYPYSPPRKYKITKTTNDNLHQISTPSGLFVNIKTTGYLPTPTQSSKNLRTTHETLRHYSQGIPTQTVDGLQKTNEKHGRLNTKSHVRKVWRKILPAVNNEPAVTTLQVSDRQKTDIHFGKGQLRKKSKDLEDNKPVTLNKEMKENSDLGVIFQGHPCMTSDTTLLPHPRHCHWYYNCSLPHGDPRWRVLEPLTEECQYPQLFSRETRSCRPYHEVSCGARQEARAPCEYRVNTCTHPGCSPCETQLASCAGLPDGLHPFPAQEPNSWFMTCKDGRTLEQNQCQDDTPTFSPVLKECVTAELASMALDGDSCSGRLDGPHPDQTGRCNRYFTCRSEQFINSATCSDDAIFDPVTKGCDQSAHVPPCGDVTDLDQAGIFCSGQYDGFYADLYGRCSLYFECRLQKIRAFLKCPYGHFNPKIQGCDTSLDLHAPCGVGRNPCMGREDGLYTDTVSNCVDLITCRNNYVSKIEPCPDGRVFDSVTKKCQSPELAAFPCGIAPVCDGQPDGKHWAKAKGCQHYYKCQEGVFTGYGKCDVNDGGVYFNPDTRACDFPQNICPPCGHKANCTKPN